MDPYIGEIHMFAGSYAPVGWALCDGSILQISEYEVLFTLIGTTYGGDGQQTFALPDLRGRTPIHQGNAPGQQAVRYLGQRDGAEEVVLTPAQMPQHTHAAQGASASGTATDPAGAAWASATTAGFHAGAPSSVVTLAPQALQPAGGNQPHENRSPVVAVNFIIALEGIYPVQP